MKNKNIFKRITASVLTAAIAFQFGTSVYPERVQAADIDADYVIYSADDTVINTASAVINGNVYTGDKFDYRGPSVCYLNEMLNAHDRSGNIRALSTADARSAMPDYSYKLSSGVTYDIIYDGDQTLSNGRHDLSSSIYTKGDMKICNTVFSGVGYIKADGNIMYDAVQNEDDSEVFLCTENGDIVIQGTDLTLNGIIYAPNGKVEINAKHLRLNGAIIAKNTELNGTDIEIGKMTDPYSVLLEKGPEMHIKGSEGSHRENRLITLDISESKGIDELNESTINWSFEAVDPSLQNAIRIDDEASTSTVKKLVITKAGKYRVTLTAKNKDGEDVLYHSTLNVTEDIAPVAGFWVDKDTAERDADGKAVFELEDTSFSVDGDNIGSRIWSVYFDSDNDGDFTDEKEEVFSLGNETKVKYSAPSVGKYQFRLQAAEYFEDTIPKLISADAYLGADSFNNENTKSKTEVVNVAPVTNSGISKAKNVDIVVTVGNADTDEINIINKNAENIKKELESKGFSVNLSTVSTTTLTARDKFAWDEYDHYNYQDAHLPTLDKHILYEKDSIKMVGYSWAPLRDWLFVDDGIQAKRVLSFDMVRDKTDWHSMEGGGFLFNTSIKEVEVKNDEENAETTTEENNKPKKVRKLSGYCVLLTGGAFKLIQFNDIDADEFRDGGISSSAQSAGKVLATSPVSNSYDEFNVRIITSERTVSVYANNEPKIENFVLPDKNTGTGFGPIICHGPHGCSQQSYFTFSNIKMSTINGSELSDILDKHEWRDSAEHYVINLSKSSNYDLNDDLFVGSAIKSLTENDIELIGLGTADSKDQYTNLFRSSNGAYFDWYDLLKTPDLIQKYIEDELSGIDYSIKEDTITTSDEIDYNGHFVDKENDPVGEQYWDYTLDASVYENSKGESGAFTKNAPITVFDATGKYSISSKLKDDPSNGNEHLKDYGKWSNARNWTDCLYVHSRPVAEITSDISASDQADKMICTLSFNAYDPDAKSKDNKGIKEEKYQWKCIQDQNWIDGTVPRVIDTDKVYLQKYEVCDEMGQWSAPCVELIYAEKTENPDQFKDDLPPTVEITVSDMNPYRGDSILVSVSAKDDNEVAYVSLKANGKVISNYQGSVIYSCSSSGEVLFTAECKDIGGNLSNAEKKITVQGPRDSVPPTITINAGKDIVYDGTTLSISGSIKDETKFGEYKVSYAKKDSDDFKVAFSSDKEVENDTIASFDVNVEDKEEYTVVIEAVDAEGNKRFANYNLTLKKEEKVKASGNQTTEKKVTPKRENIPSEIKLEASAYLAEIGDTVIVTVDAEDQDGLVSLITYKDNKKVGEQAGELRFSEIEAKTVTIKAVATDALGARTEKSIEIVFQDTSDKTPPKAEITVPENDKSISGKVTVIGSAYDETALRKYQLDYKKGGTENYLSIASSLYSKQDEVLGEWDTYPLDNGVYELRLTAIDNGGNTATYTREYQVENGAVKPVEVDDGSDIGDDSGNDKDAQSIFFSKPQTSVTVDKVLKVEAQADPKLVNGQYEVYVQKTGDDSKQIKIGSGTIGSDGKISASVDTSMYDDGKYEVAIAVKGNNIDVCEKTKATIKHTYKEADDEKYTCSIVSPTDVEQISGIYEVKAKITPDVFKNFKFEYAAAGSNNFVRFDEGKISNESEITASLDTTLLENGYYDIRLTAYNDEIKASDTVTADIIGNLKIGNFTISFNDIEEVFSGIPVSVIRTYDSRTKDVLGDFGYGWNMTFNSAKISVSCTPGINWNTVTSKDTYLVRYDIKETRSHRIKIDLGNGNTDEFALTLSPSGQMFIPVQYGISASYTALNGSKAKLEAYDQSGSDLIFNADTLITEDAELYDPKQFLYTKADGTKYLFDVNKGLIQVTTATGETLKFDENGIKASDGKAITYTKDDDGKIIEVSTYNGKKVSYEYNSYGDLVSASDLSGNVTKFVYRDHYITEIYDPRNVLLSRNEYDSDGRLISSTDSNGKITKYEHDIDGREEIITDRNGGVTKYVYDEHGNVISATDPMGNTIKKSYDKNGKLISKTTASGNVTTYKYNENGDLASMTDSEGNTISNTYNQKGLISSINAMGIDIITLNYDELGTTTSTVDALGNSINYEYGAKGRLTSVSDSIGQYMNMTYDNDGNVLSTVDGAGSTTDFTYDEKGNCISKIIKYHLNGEEKTFTENYTYDDAGNVIQKSDNAGGLTTNEYNAIGKVSKTVDEKGRQTRYDYSNMGDLTKITYADGTTETFTYDNEGNNLTATDRLGRTLTMEYDKVGNLVSKTYPSGISEKYEYDADYNLISKTAVNGAVTKYEYDTIGRNTAITDALGKRTEFTYNSNSLLASMKDPKGNIISYSYDLNGNRTGITYPDGTSASTAYDSRGRVVSQTDQNGYTTSYTYDGADRLTGVTDVYGNTTKYAYNEVGNLISITDANNNVTSYEYDEHSHVVKTVNALGQTSEFTYDVCGNVLTSTDFGGKLTSYTYDNYDRVTRKHTDDGNTGYSYTRDGKLASGSNKWGTCSFAYDAMDNISKITYPDGSYVEYAYDEYGRMTGLNTPYGSTEYGYDILDRLVSVKDNTGSTVRYIYDDNGNRSETNYSNGQKIKYYYDSNNRLVSEYIYAADENVIAKYEYTIGKAGEKTSVVETDRTVNYTYDQLYRLTSEVILDNEGKIVSNSSYTYDNVSNRMTKTVDGEETTYSYNALNQLIKENSTEYEYDGAGNLVSVTSPDKSSLFTYNADNKMIRATVQEGNDVNVEEYEYDFAGNRITKKTENDYVHYLNDLNSELAQVIAEVNKDGAVLCNYTRGLELISQRRDDKTSFYLTDGHGSVRQLADENGTVTDKYDYDAWGNLISSEGETVNSYLYCAEALDSTTGLYYLRARYMDPTTGTFTSMDTYQGDLFDPATLHKYLYANANPVTYNDPTGNFFTLAEFSISNAIDNILESETYAKYVRIYQKIKKFLDVLDIACTIYDTGRELTIALMDPTVSGEEVVGSILRGIATSIFINHMCKLKRIGPIISKVVIAMTMTSQFDSIIQAAREGDVGLVIVRTIQLLIQILSLHQNCFTGDTLVATEDGKRRIDEIEVGDKVWSYDIFTGKTELKEVTKVYVHEVDEILHLYTTCDEIDTTTNHPFYVIGRGWVAADDLNEGDEIYLIDGSTAFVTGAELEHLDEPIKVYNLEVADFNTYFVGDDAVLVHNYEEVADTEISYERARNKAQDTLGDLGADSEPYICSIEGSPLYGQVTGRKSADGKRRWRLDYDDNKGPHINVEDFTTGKGDKATKIAIPFWGDFETILSLLKHLNR